MKLAWNEIKFLRNIVMTERVNVGEAIARVLEAHQVDSIYGVI